MKRLFDFISASLLLFVILPIILFISLLIKSTSHGPILFISDRVGVKNSIFKMYKFRTMIVGTPSVATHLLTDSNRYLTPIGGLLRKTSLDELPQLFNIIRGDMSVVGPRPALYNQDNLIELRTKKRIHELVPGFTGWAQINGRDELSIPIKVDFDEYYLRHKCLLLDLKIIWKTIYKVVKAEGNN
ncbi:sugar transferase [Candidatus Pacearchaeota archaeon]|nr:sugar transferase [Candidatus Pacearchaeota archaeon]